MLSCDKRLPLDTWPSSGSQESNQFSTFNSSRNSDQGILLSTTPSATGAVPVHIGAETLRKRSRSTQFPCRHLQEGRRPWVLQYRWIIRIILLLDSKDSRNQNFNLTNKFPTPSTFSCWKTRWLLVLIFFSEAMLWTKEVQTSQERMNSMNDSGEFYDVESICGGKFSRSQQGFQVRDLC